MVLRTTCGERLGEGMNGVAGVVFAHDVDGEPGGREIRNVESHIRSAGLEQVEVVGAGLRVRRDLTEAVASRNVHGGIQDARGHRTHRETHRNGCVGDHGNRRLRAEGEVDRHVRLAVLEHLKGRNREIAGADVHQEKSKASVLLELASH